MRLPFELASAANEVQALRPDHQDQPAMTASAANLPVPPICCQRCTHLVALHSPGASRTACLRALPLSAACGWWRPRRRGVAEASEPAPDLHV